MTPAPLPIHPAAPSLLAEALMRIDLVVPCMELASRSPAGYATLLRGATLVADVPRLPSGHRIIDAALEAALGAYFADQNAPPVALQSLTSALLDQLVQVAYLDIRDGEEVWDPIAGMGMAGWREGRGRIEQHYRGLVGGLPAMRRALARRFMARADEPAVTADKVESAP